MPHICGEEIMMFMMALPWVGAVFLWIKMKFQGKTVPKEEHQANCEYTLATQVGSEWSGNHPVACTCKEAEHPLERSTYR